MLPIFPEGGLASSVITTVWVGVFVLCFFNLRFGWVLSGLVVPGYLVPLVIVKPVAALVIVVEAILAYAIVWLFSEKLAPGRYPSLFGRDRFMGLILASVAVRLVLDGYLLPLGADWLASNYNQRLDWQSDLQSFGLVIISLLANQFWKPGLVRGLFSMIVVTFLSWLIVRYGLMVFTNFRISGVTYLYEGLASSVLASPKAYMILILTALYASHMNVKYGWDFSGILIPALIALQWYQPTKILTSFVEAAAIYLIARQVLKLPWLANVTMEGANKILLFFNISFALKLLVGHAILWLGWDVKTTDFYGFGYLLSTLLAIKAHDKDIFPRLLRSTLQVSAVGAVAGNIAGLALAFLVPVGMASAARADGMDAAAERNAILTRAIGSSWLRAGTGGAVALSEAETRALADAVAVLDAGLPALQAGSAATADGWTFEALGDGRIALVRTDGDGGETLFFDPGANNAIAVTVPDAGAAPGIALAGAQLAERIGARWLVLASSPGAATGVGENAMAVFRRVHEGPEIALDAGGSAATPVLALAGRGATGIDLDALRAAIPDLDVTFAPARTAPATTQTAPARLSLGPVAIASLGGASEAENIAADCLAGEMPARGEVDNTLETRLVLRNEVVLPLLAALDEGTEPAAARRAARMIDMALDRCRLNGELRWRLSSPAGQRGLYLFDAQGRRDRIVVSALNGEVTGTPGDFVVPAPHLLDAGVQLADAADAQMLALAPRELAYDGSQARPFGIVYQAVVDTLRNEPALILQVRSAPETSGIRLTSGEAAITPDQLGMSDAALAPWVGIVRSAGYEPLVARRARETAGYETFALATLNYLRHSLNKRYAVVFIPPEER